MREVERYASLFDTDTPTDDASCQWALDTALLETLQFVAVSDVTTTRIETGASAFGIPPRARRNRWRNRVRGIRPEDPRQVVQRNPRAPAILRGPDPHARHHGKHGEAQHTMKTQHAEIDHRDDCGDRQAIPEDDEGPHVTGIP